MKKIFIAITLVCAALPVNAQKMYEKDYNSNWCSAQGGVLEYKTKDGSRVDCLLDEWAIECERAYKWKEAVGQALFYAIQTERKPGIVVIVEDFEKERKYLERLDIVAKKYQIKVWRIMSPLS